MNETDEKLEIMRAVAGEAGDRVEFENQQRADLNKLIVETIKLTDDAKELSSRNFDRLDVISDKMIVILNNLEKKEETQWDFYTNFLTKFDNEPLQKLEGERK